MEFEVELHELQQSDFEFFIGRVEQVEDDFYYLLKQGVIVDGQLAIDVG